MCNRVLAYWWTGWYTVAEKKIIQEQRSSCVHWNQWECCHCLWGKGDSTLFHIFLFFCFCCISREKLFHIIVCVYSFVSSSTRLGLFRCWETREINFTSDCVLCDCISMCRSEGDSKSRVPKARADATESPDLPEGIKGRQSRQREPQICHSLWGILEITVISEAEEHWRISVTKGNQSDGPAVRWPGVDSRVVACGEEGQWLDAE